MMERGRGGIGRRAGFRYQWRKSWGFESLRPHHLADGYANGRAGGGLMRWWTIAGICENHVTPLQINGADLSCWSKNPIWSCCHIINRPNAWSWRDKG